MPLARRRQVGCYAPGSQTKVPGTGLGLACLPRPKKLVPRYPPDDITEVTHHFFFILAQTAMHAQHYRYPRTVFFAIYTVESLNSLWCGLLKNLLLNIFPYDEALCFDESSRIWEFMCQTNDGHLARPSGGPRINLDCPGIF